MKAPIWEITKLAYRDAWRALIAMPTLASIAGLVSLVQGFVLYILVPQVLDREATLADKALGFAISVAASFLLTPFLIAVHRYILLGDVTRRYVLDVQNTRFLRFFADTILLLAISEVGTVIKLLTGPTVAGGLLIFAIGVVMMIVVLQTIMLFPAIAIDAPGSSINHAIRDSKGNVWRIGVIVFLVMLPPLVPLVAGIAIGWPPEPGRIFAGVTAGRTIQAVLFGFYGTATQILLVAAASHLYRILVRHLSQAAAARATSHH